MATTDLPPLGDPNPDISIAEAVRNIRALHERAQGDLDKTTDLYEGHYYGGVVDACTELEQALTVEKAEKDDD